MNRQSIGEAVRLFSAIMLAVLLLVVVADEYTFAYAARFVDLRIALIAARPTLLTLAIALAYLAATTIAFVRVPQFRSCALVLRVFREGFNVNLGVGAGRAFTPVLIASYLVLPWLAGAAAGASTSQYAVVAFDEPHDGYTEGIIVGPTDDGILLVPFDRAKHVIVADVPVREDLGVPHRAHLERLGAIATVDR